MSRLLEGAGRLAREWRVAARLPGWGFAVALVAVGFALGWLGGITIGERPAALVVVAVHGPPEPVVAGAVSPPRAPRSLPTRLATAGLPGALPKPVPPAPAMGLPMERQSALAPSEPPPREPVGPPVGPPPPRVAVLLDDMGLLEDVTWKAIALDAAISMAFLPYPPNTEALVEAARAAGHQVLLHMPMEPGGSADPGPAALLVSLSAEEIRQRLTAAFAAVPGAIGLNNHMGSLFTADSDAMAAVIDVIAARNLMILDSMTTPDSVVTELARALGVPSGARDVFLDNDRAPSAIAAQLAEAERIARVTGLAVAIGHPYEETLEAIALWLPRARAAGIELVPIAFAATPALTAVATARPALNR